MRATQINFGDLETGDKFRMEINGAAYEKVKGEAFRIDLVKGKVWVDFIPENQKVFWIL